MPKPRNKRYEYMLEQLVERNLWEGETLVDCACGDGYGAAYLQSAGISVLGFDLDEELIAKTKSRGVGAQVANICKLPCVDNMADIFVCSETLEHLDRDELTKAVFEIKRVTKENGIICITVPADKKICMKNKLHKQYMSSKDLEGVFSEYRVLFSGKFCKKPGRCNTVMFFGR